MGTWMTEEHVLAALVVAWVVFVVVGAVLLLRRGGGTEYPAAGAEDGSGRDSRA